MQSKNYQYVFTLNNYIDADLKRLMSVKPDYVVVFGREVAPTTGTPHLQGCLYRADGERFKRVTALNMIGRHAFVDKSNSLDGAIGYCLKDGDWWTNLPDLEARKAEIDEALKYGKEHTWLGSVFLNYPDQSICEGSHSMHVWNRSH